jgi:ferredoxin
LNKACSESKGSTDDMMTLQPRPVAPTEDHCESCAFYCVVVSCVSLMLFIVLAAAVSVSRACAIVGAVVLLLGLVGGWLAATGNGAAGPAAQAAAAPVVRLVVQQHRCACGLAEAAIAALPTFAYEPPAAKNGDGGEEVKPRGSCVLCAVCLEDVRAGEMVRQLPACRHLFHVDCVDAWLRAHRTCPLCRGQLSLGSVNTKTAAVAESPVDALPPV